MLCHDSIHLPTHEVSAVMFAIGEKACDGLGLNQSRYQWVIDAAEREAFEVFSYDDYCSTTTKMCCAALGREGAFRRGRGTCRTTSGAGSFISLRTSLESDC